MKQCFLIIILVVFAVNLYSTEMTQLIDCPTAGIRQKGEVDFPILMYKNGGVLVGTHIGLIRRLMLGVNYGGEKIIGDEDPDWHPRVDFNIKYRLFDESPKLPALAFGFNSQGYGRFDKVNDRYELKSKGFYAVISKNFNILGDMGIHLGTNYSLEKTDDEDLNFFVGMDKAINEQISIYAEYDFALNDNKKITEAVPDSTNANRLGKGDGYFNAGVNIDIAENLILTFFIRDILGNDDSKTMDKSLMIKYIMSF